MEINFKYKIGQMVFYNGRRYKVLSRCYLETKDKNVIKYNLRSVDNMDMNGYEPNVWEEDIYTLKLV